MKAICVDAYSARQIFFGIKTVECRPYATDHRGPLLVCSTPKKESGCIAGRMLCLVNLKDVVPFKRKHLKPADMEGYPVPRGDFAWIFEPVDWVMPEVVKERPGVFDVDDAQVRVIPPSGSNQADVEKYFLPHVFFHKDFADEDKQLWEDYLGHPIK